MPVNPVTLAILAGGEGARMGRPKAHLRVNDAPILAHLFDRLQWPGPTLLITAPGRQRPPGAERVTRECVDPVAGQGPLRGVLTALENAPTPLVVITAVDMPMIEGRHLDELIDRVGTSMALMPARLIDGRRQLEPFPSIFHVDAIETVRARLARDARSVARLCGADQRFATIDVTWEPTAWLNLNHPSDLPLLAQHGLRVR
jgi:molybdopterin-guanine dinucleotide biosynthesis protein A